MPFHVGCMKHIQPLLNSTDKITKQSVVKSDIVSREIYGTYPVYQV